MEIASIVWNPQRPCVNRVKTPIVSKVWRSTVSGILEPFWHPLVQGLRLEQCHSVLCFNVKFASIDSLLRGSIVTNDAMQIASIAPIGIWVLHHSQKAYSGEL